MSQYHGRFGDSGAVYRIVGADGAERFLVQVPGEVNGIAGRFEWIVDDAMNMPHQRFVPGGFHQRHSQPEMILQPSFHIPFEFIAVRTLPTAAELVWGHQHGWISRTDAVEISLIKYQLGAQQQVPEERLALLLSDEIDLVDDLISQIDPKDEPIEAQARFWLFLSLAFVFEKRRDLVDPLTIVEDLYGEFDYPVEIQGMVRYIPVQAGMPTGVTAIFERWAAWLEEVGAEYAQRLRIG